MAVLTNHLRHDLYCGAQAQNASFQHFSAKYCLQKDFIVRKLWHVKNIYGLVSFVCWNSSQTPKITKSKNMQKRWIASE